MKTVNPLLAGVHIAAMVEAITFAMTQGIEPEAVLDVIPRCADTSSMLENRGPHVVEGDHAPRSSVDIWPKDLGIVPDLARDARFGAPLTAAALQQSMAASGSGLGGRTTRRWPRSTPATPGSPSPATAEPDRSCHRGWPLGPGEPPEPRSTSRPGRGGPRGSPDRPMGA